MKILSDSNFEFNKFNVLIVRSVPKASESIKLYAHDVDFDYETDYELCVISSRSVRQIISRLPNFDCPHFCKKLST